MSHPDACPLATPADTTRRTTAGMASASVSFTATGTSQRTRCPTRPLPSGRCASAHAGCAGAAQTVSRTRGVRLPRQRVRRRAGPRRSESDPDLPGRRLLRRKESRSLLGPRRQGPDRALAASPDLGILGAEIEHQRHECIRDPARDGRGGAERGETQRLDPSPSARIGAKQVIQQGARPEQERHRDQRTGRCPGRSTRSTRACESVRAMTPIGATLT